MGLFARENLPFTDAYNAVYLYHTQAVGKASGGVPLRVGQDFHVWIGGDVTRYVRAVSIRPIPPGSESVINVGPLDAEQEVVVPGADKLGFRSNELARPYIDVGDAVQVTLAEKMDRPPRTHGIRLVIDLFVRSRDPGLESTLFWLWGGNRDLLACSSARVAIGRP